ncbi:hypothetical protein DPSP01_003236 [Paraphaeosphaeria sporulosa]
MSPHRILLTGANGYIATHILSQLLASPDNHFIRAVVRSQSKAEDVQSIFPNASPSRLEFVVVPDMTAHGAFDEALKSELPFDIVMHTASPFKYDAAGSPSDFIDPAVKGTTEILAGIQRVAGSSVKRVILTASFAAVGAWGLRDEKNKVYTEEDWFPVTSADVEARGSDKNFVYLASKTFAEQAAWEAQKADSVTWDLVAINPVIVYGPLLHKVKSVDNVNESMAIIWNKFLKEANPEGEIPPNGVPLYVDARDVAEAHVLALDNPEAANQRFILAAALADSQKIADILRAVVPGANERVPKGTPGKSTFPADQWSADNSKVQRVLGLKFRSAEETFGDSGRQLLELIKAV